MREKERKINVHDVRMCTCAVAPVVYVYYKV